MGGGVVETRPPPGAWSATADGQLRGRSMRFRSTRAGSSTTVAPARSSRSTSGPLSGTVTSTTAPAPVIADTLSSTTRSDPYSSAPGCATSTRTPESRPAGSVADAASACGVTERIRGDVVPSRRDPTHLPEPLREREQCVCRVRDEQEAIQRHEDDGHAEEEEGDAEDAVVGREHEQRADASTRRAGSGDRCAEPGGSR